MNKAIELKNALMELFLSGAESESQEAYMAGLLDDINYDALREQALSVRPALIIVPDRALIHRVDEFHRKYIALFHRIGCIGLARLRIRQDQYRLSRTAAGK